MEVISYEQIAKSVFLKHKDLAPQEQRKLAAEKMIDEMKKKMKYKKR